MRVLVETASGTLEGSADNGVLAFKGVRYGAPTSGARRFRPPEPVAPWTGVRTAHEFGPSCPPTVTDADRAFLSTSPLWATYAGADVGVGYSEDCLSLNVWTPALGDGARRPVLVWLHGGGFAWGSGSSVLARGDGLARRHGAVVVTLNHRLGILGYLHLAALGGDQWRGSGVAGLLDVQLALQWIRENISVFGGDANKVALVGHSGGASKVACLLAMPAAKGLFQRAIIQSGPVSLRSMDATESAAVAEQVINACGIDQRALERLQDVPVDILTNVGRDLRFRPVVDGELLPTHPYDPSAPPTATGVPLLIGTTKHDSATFKFDSDPQYARLDERGLRERLVNHPHVALGDKVDTVLSLFRTRQPEASPTELLMLIATARLRARVATIADRTMARGDTPVFMYRFDYEASMGPDTAFAGQRLSPHALEIPFVFDIADRVDLAGPCADRLDVAVLVSSYWVAFADRGDPNRASLPRWPRYDTVSRANMVLDVIPTVEFDPGADERALFADL